MHRASARVSAADRHERQRLIVCQVKLSLTLSAGTDSELFSVVKQFVEQYRVSQQPSTGSRLWDRPLDPEKDRLVLVCGPGSSGPIKRGLPQVLDRRPDCSFRRAHEFQRLEARPLNWAVRAVAYRARW